MFYLQFLEILNISIHFAKTSDPQLWEFPIYQ